MINFTKAEKDDYTVIVSRVLIRIFETVSSEIVNLNRYS